MRRLSLWLSMLALAGLLLGACDLEREQEVDVSEAESAEECASETPVASPSEATAALPSETSVVAPSQTPVAEATSTPVESATVGDVAATDPASPSPVPSEGTAEATPCPQVSEAPRASPDATPEPTAKPAEAVADWPTGGFVVFTREIPSEGQGDLPKRLWRANINGGDQAETRLPEGCPSVHTYQFGPPGSDGMNAYQLNSARVHYHAPQISPSGTQVAFICGAGGAEGAPVYVTEIEDESMTLVSGKAIYGSAYWSPDGNSLAYLAANVQFGVPPHLHIASTGRAGYQDQDYGGAYSSSLGQWTPNGRVTFDGAWGVCGEPGPTAYPCDRVWVFDPRTRDAQGFPDVTSLGPWSTDGRYVLGSVNLAPLNAWSNYPAPDYAVELIDTSTGLRQRIQMEDANIAPSFWLPGGQSFLVAISAPAQPFTPADCSLWKIDVSDINARSEFLPEDCGAVYLSRDGNYLYSVRAVSIEGPAGLLDQRGDLYRIDLRNGDATMLIEDIATVAVYEPAP